jgi:hypothetical protein
VRFSSLFWPWVKMAWRQGFACFACFGCFGCFGCFDCSQRKLSAKTRSLPKTEGVLFTGFSCSWLHSSHAYLAIAYAASSSTFWSWSDTGESGDRMTGDRLVLDSVTTLLIFVFLRTGTVRRSNGNLTKCTSFLFHDALLLPQLYLRSDHCNAEYLVPAYLGSFGSHSKTEVHVCHRNEPFFPHIFGE